MIVVALPIQAARAITPALRSAVLGPGARARLRVVGIPVREARVVVVAPDALRRHACSARVVRGGRGRRRGRQQGQDRALFPGPEVSERLHPPRPHTAVAADPPCREGGDLHEREARYVDYPKRADEVHAIVELLLGQRVVVRTVGAYGW